MPAMQADLLKQLEQLLARTSSDFAAIAAVGCEADRTIRWLCGSGNGNERFLQMKEKSGAGIAGWVVRHGRPLAVRSKEPDAERRRRSYPIMLAESLHAAAAAPIRSDTDIVGVLLVGRRTDLDYTLSDMTVLEQEADRFSGAIVGAGGQPV